MMGVWIKWCVGIIVLSAIPFVSYATIAEDAPLTLCDKLSAHPNDPDRVTNGIDFENIDVEAALKACLAALREFPSSSRLSFQTGRVYDRLPDIDQSEEYYLEAAALGSLQAILSLSMLYDEFAAGTHGDMPSRGLMVERWSKLIVHLRKHVNEENVDAEIYLGEALLRRNRDGDLEEAVSVLLPYSGKDRPHVDFVLGTYYGYFVKDKAKARAHFLIAAEQGHIRAQMRFVDFFQFDIGEPKKGVNELEPYRRAADEGDPNAQFLYGTMLFRNAEFSNSLEGYDAAFKFVRMAADQQHLGADYFLATMYMPIVSYRSPDDSVTEEELQEMVYGRTIDEALDWAEAGAEQRMPEATGFLATMYWHGIHVDIDKERGLHLFQRSAALGSEGSKTTIGLIEDGVLD
jgi:TPR repeat protein